MKRKSVDNSIQAPSHAIDPAISKAYHSWLGKFKSAKKTEAVRKNWKRASLILKAKHAKQKARKLEIINSMTLQKLDLPDAGNMTK